jgi:hypothetical protein
MNNAKRNIKFHGNRVENIVIRYVKRSLNSNDGVIEEFDALKIDYTYETVNVQVVADYITITFYKNEKENLLLYRELIPTHRIEHVWIQDTDIDNLSKLYQKPE